MGPITTRLVLLIIFVLMSGGVVSGDEKPNILLICVDDLRPELNCFGKTYIHSPNIDALAKRGRLFHRHYVQAPTCGASRFALLCGRYGSPRNNALFERADLLRKNPNSTPPSLPAWFRQHGYTTVSVGKVSHHPGGCGGPDWDDKSQLEMPKSWDRHLLPAGPWKHPRGAMHGLANGEIRDDPSEMDVFQTREGSDSIYPDGLITDQALSQLDQLATDRDQPFLLAIGIIRPHLPWGAPERYLQPYREIELPPITNHAKPAGKTTWHGSGEFMKYNRRQRDPNKDAEFATVLRKHYAACVSYADAQIGRVLDRLDRLDLRDNTIIVLWGDNGWHLGEQAVWGKHTLFEESLRTPLIIEYPDMPRAGQATQSVVESIDVFPTLCEMANLPKPDFLQGISLRPILLSPDTPGHFAVSYANGRTVRTATHRLIAHPGGQIELYDHTSAANESLNVADQHPQLVQELLGLLNQRIRQPIKSRN